MKVRLNPWFRAKTLDDVIRATEDNQDALVKRERDEFPPEAWLRDVTQVDLEAKLRVVRTQTVRFDGQQVTLRRDTEFRLGRYGRCNVNDWIREYDLRIVPADWKPEELPAPEAPEESIVSDATETVEEPKAKRGRRAARG